MAGHSTEHGEWKRLGDGSLLTQDADVGLGHIVPIQTYIKVYLSLICLTGITVWAATQDFGMFNLLIAILIASIKASVVTFFFMHLKFENKLIWGIAIYPFFILALMIIGTLGDSAAKYQSKPAFNSGPGLVGHNRITTDTHKDNH